jgi:hypothetical protein
MPRHLHFELLLGRKVVDADGRPAGRILEVIADRAGADLVITHYELGTAALLDRLGLTTRRLLGFRPRAPYVVPWHQMDLTDPDHPRLTVRREELRREEGVTGTSAPTAK